VKLISPAILLFWPLGCMLALALGLTADGWWQVPLFLGGGAGLFWIWRRFPWSDNWSRYLSFGAVVLIAGSVNRLLYIADILLGTADADWPFFSSSAELAIFKGEVVTVLGTLLTVTAWVMAGGARYSPDAILEVPRRDSRRLLSVVYLCSVGALATEHWFPGMANAFGQLLYTLLGLGIATTFFLPIVVMQSGPTRVCLAAMLSAPFVYFSLGTGMKEDIILALMPVAYMTWTASRKVMFRTAVVGVSAVVISLVTVYVTQYREDVWQSGNQISSTQAVTRFAESTDSYGGLATVMEGLKAFLHRSNASVERGWAISLADEHGHEPRLVFAPLAYVFIPRALWPDKPVIRQGWEYSGLVFGDAFIAWSGSSTAAGLYPACYLGFGWTGVIVSAVSIGLMMAGLLKLASRVGGGPLVALFAMTMVPYALRLDENWTVGALSAPIISFAYLVAILFVSKALSGVLTGPGPTFRPAAERPRVQSAPVA